MAAEGHRCRPDTADSEADLSVRQIRIRRKVSIDAARTRTEEERPEQSMDIQVIVRNDWCYDSQPAISGF